MGLKSDVRVVEVEWFFLPVEMRVPLKFGAQTVRRVVCARARVVVEGRDGRRGTGWGETPLSVAWVWPSTELGWEAREGALEDFCAVVAGELAGNGVWGHPMEIGRALQGMGHAGLPQLAALCVQSVFDLAVYDAYGQLHGRPVFELLGRGWLGPDLGEFTEGELSGVWPEDFLRPRVNRLPVWHLVGGLDAVGEGDLTGEEPKDGHPVTLRGWIRRDGLKCLKIKLRGNDAGWDWERLLRVGRMAVEEGCVWLTADFNCTVTDPGYVTEILDRLLAEEPRLYQMLLYIEQPFPYELGEHRIDVRAVCARKPLFLDESAHDWTQVRLGRELGWTGVALKTCKTLTGALVSLAWARAHGMTLMVQDLTNPMLAQIPHVLLAAHAGTIMGVESNGMQFYPAASALEESRHPGVYRRREGVLELGTLSGPGFGAGAELGVGRGRRGGGA